MSAADELPPTLLRGTAAPAADVAAAELSRMRRRISQQDHALARLTEALLTLKRGGQALRAENRELRLQLEVAQRHRAILRASRGGRHRETPKRAA